MGLVHDGGLAGVLLRCGVVLLYIYHRFGNTVFTSVAEMKKELRIMFCLANPFS